MDENNMLGFALFGLPEFQEDSEKWEDSSIKPMDWLALLAICFTGELPTPNLEDVSLERITEGVRYLRENKAKQANELMDFMKAEISDMVKEAWEATAGK